MKAICSINLLLFSVLMDTFHMICLLKMTGNGIWSGTLPQCFEDIYSNNFNEIVVLHLECPIYNAISVVNRY